jgi:hypothetical protein
MAAAHATLEILEEGNREVYKRTYTVGEKLMNGMAFTYDLRTSANSTCRRPTPRKT